MRPGVGDRCGAGAVGGRGGRAILKGLKQYGMFVADNGIEWAISVAPDERIAVLHEELRRVKGSAFEVVQPPR